MGPAREVLRKARLRSAIAAGLAVLTATGALALGAAQAAPGAAAATAPRVDLGVLVVTDGSPWVEAIRQQLDSEGVPVTVVSLGNSGRPAIDSAFLSGKLASGTAEGHFQGVVLSSDAPSGLSAAEVSALASYETAFSVRQVDAYTYPGGNVGLNPPAYGGSLDGSATTVTAAAKADGFGYLKGSFDFQGTAGGSQSFGYLAQPLASTSTASFTPFLTEKIPGTSTAGTLAGVYRNSGREQLVVGFGYNYFQLQYRYLAHGIADWVTRGVHPGYWRNYLTADADDVFNADAEWSQPGKCTPNDSTCPPGTKDTTPSRMTPADVTFASSWQNSHSFKLEFLYNGGASPRFQVGGTDPLLTAFKPVAGDFWWVSHTFTHQWLGCVQDFTVTPWRCATDSGGATQWVDAGTINGEITSNIQWARQNGIPIEPDELAPGEYSGLRILPQQPADNPNLIQAISSNGIKWVPLDASREPAMRPVGSALGVPRHPIDVFYNVSTKASEVSEYNWIYDAAADGGSGLCTAAGTACLPPLNLKTGWDSSILPRQITTMLTSVVQNDPRPFMFHQSNLAGDRLLYPVVNGVLSSYRAVYAASAPVVNQRLSAAGTAMNSQDRWAQVRGAGTVSGYVQGSAVTINGPSGTSVPVTVPNGTKVGTAKGAAFGSAYGGEQSAYTTLGSGTLTLTLKSAPYPGSSATASATAATTPATKSTATINAARDPADLPKGKLGSAIINATSGQAAVSGPAPAKGR